MAISMDRKPVESSIIKAIGYSPDKRMLELEFSTGIVYEYPNVTPEEYNALISANSHGKFFHRFIKPKHEGRRV